jgi:hypothetical protein
VLQKPRLPRVNVPVAVCNVEDSDYEQYSQGWPVAGTLAYAFGAPWMRGSSLLFLARAERVDI